MRWFSLGHFSFYWIMVLKWSSSSRRCMQTKCRLWSLKAEPAQLQDHHRVESLAVFQLSFLFFILSYFAYFNTEAVLPSWLILKSVLEVHDWWIKFKTLSRFHSIRAWLSLLIDFLSTSIRDKTRRKLFHNSNITFYKTNKTQDFVF